jgi:hypothetical protein
MKMKGGQCMEKKSFIEYKGKPLVREGDVLYYGFPKEKYILRLDIFMKDANDNPTMVFATICPTNDQKKIVKQIGKSGIYDSLDVGAIWLDQCIKENPLGL